MLTHNLGTVEDVQSMVLIVLLSAAFKSPMAPCKFSRQLRDGGRIVIRLGKRVATLPNQNKWSMSKVANAQDWP